MFNLFRRTAWPVAIALAVVLVWGCGDSKNEKAASTVENLPPNTYVEKEAGFSYSPPEGWNMSAMPGMKFKFAYDTPVNDFAPNINVVDMTHDGDMDDLLDMNMRQMEIHLPGYARVSESDFSTDTGIKGKKVVYESFQQNRKLRHQLYVFPGKNEKVFALTLTRPADAAAHVDALADRSARTFRVED